jgi:hypothetical protein
MGIRPSEKRIPEKGSEGEESEKEGEEEEDRSRLGKINLKKYLAAIHKQIKTFPVRY